MFIIYFAYIFTPENCNKAIITAKGICLLTRGNINSEQFTCSDHINEINGDIKYPLNCIISLILSSIRVKVIKIEQMDRDWCGLIVSNIFTIIIICL